MYKRNGKELTCNEMPIYDENILKYFNILTIALTLFLSENIIPRDFITFLFSKPNIFNFTNLLQLLSLQILG